MRRVPTSSVLVSILSTSSEWHGRPYTMSPDTIPRSHLNFPPSMQLDASYSGPMGYTSSVTVSMHRTRVAWPGMQYIFLFGPSSPPRYREVPRKARGSDLSPRRTGFLVFPLPRSSPSSSRGEGPAVA